MDPDPGTLDPPKFSKKFISKSVHNVLNNLADIQTNRQTDRQTEVKKYDLLLSAEVMTAT